MRTGKLGTTSTAHFQFLHFVKVLHSTECLTLSLNTTDLSYIKPVSAEENRETCKAQGYDKSDIISITGNILEELLKCNYADGVTYVTFGICVCQTYIFPSKQSCTTLYINRLGNTFLLIESHLQAFFFKNRAIKTYDCS
jgi:hypothetical protein